MEKNDIEEKAKRNLKPRKTIGLLLENIGERGEYQVNFRAGVTNKARELNLNLICFVGETLGYSPLNKFADTQNIVYDLAGSKNVDGLIISGTLGTFVNEMDFVDFFSRFKPIPIVSTVVSLPDIPAVIIDNEKGMRELMIHLIQDHEYKRIGFIRGPEDNPDAKQRYEAYKRVLSEHNIPLDERIIVDGDFMSLSGARAVDVLLKERKVKPGVLVAANDNMALGALDALQQWGLHVPGEIAVVGFDDDGISRNATPSLTTVYHPKYEQGEKAVEVLVTLLTGENVLGQTILPTNLIVRESCGCVDPVVAQAKAGLYTRATTASRMVLTASKQKIVANLQSKFPNLSATELEQIDKVLRDFYTELKDETNPIFLSTLENALSQMPLTNWNTILWHDLISSMRRNILPHISEEQMLFRAEDLWQQARLVIAKSARRVEGYRRLRDKEWGEKLNEISQALVTTSDESEVASILVNKFPDLEIAGCYLSIYENPSTPTEQCRSILAYQKDTGQVMLNSGDEVFPTWQLIPKGVLSQNQPYSLLVAPLCFQENQLGILVFETGHKNQRIYEALRGQLSNTLWRAHLVQLLRSLYEASNSVLSLQEPQAILDDVVKKICKTVGAKGANIFFRDKNEEPQRLVIRANYGSPFHTSGLIGTEPVLIENTKVQISPLYQKMYKEGIGATGGFPLLVKEKAVGMMWVFFEKPHRFLPAEVDALRLYVNQAAIAYDKAKRMKELEHLQQASENLASVADVREVLQQITESARDVLQADSVAIWSYDAIRQTFLPDELVTQGIPKDLVEKSKLDKPSPGGTAEFVIREGYLGVNDVDDQKYGYLGPQAHRLRGEIGVKSFQGIVLKVDDEVLGVLYVNYKVSRGFDDEEEATLKTFAHHAALALKKARLLEQVRRAYDTAKVVAEVSAQDDLQGTLKAIVDGTLNAFQCDAVTLNFYNSLTGELGYPPAMSGVRYPERVQRSKRVEPNSLVDAMLQLEEPYVVEDVAKNDDFKDRRFVKDEGIKSCVAIPLDAANQKVGVMFVNYRTQHHFTGQELDDIKLFAYQAAVAIRSAQLYDDAMTRARHLLALSKAGTAVTSTLSLNEILVRIVEQVRLITGGNGEPARLVHLGLLDGTKLRIEAWRSSNPREPQNVITLDLEHDDCIGIMGQVVKTHKSILLWDATQDKNYIEYDRTTHSELAVPIMSGKKAIGVINAEHPDYGAFDEVDQQSLEALATYVAIAIENARHVKEIEQRALQMQTASEVARDATSILNIEQLLDQAVNLISNRFHFYHIAIFLLDKGYAVLKAASSDGGKKMLQVGHKLKIGKDGIVGHVAQTGESRIVTDVNKDNDFLRNHHLADTCSEWALPLYVHGELIGVLDVQFNEQNVFSKEDITILEMMADQLAIAIHNARQYDELKQTKGQVGASTALAWMGMASNTWRHTIDKHARTIVEQIDLLRRELAQKHQADNYSQVDGRLSMIQKLAHQIEEKPITPPLSSEDGVVSVQVNVLIRERTRRLWESDPYKSITPKLYLVLNDKFTVRASPEWLRRALDILIDNAVEAMVDLPCREITIKTGQKDKWAEILISDTGKGIPPEVSSHIFVNPIKKAKGAKGMGVGLLMAQVIVQTYSGEIGVASTASTGTAMFIRLPLES